MKIYLLSGGVLDADRALIHPGDDSHRRVTLPISQVLLQDEGTTVLIDTGMPLVVAGDAGALQRVYDIEPVWMAPRAATHERVDRQLELLGMKPADLNLVINTHFHFDHAGGNALF